MKLIRILTLLGITLFSFTLISCGSDDPAVEDDDPMAVEDDNPMTDDDPTDGLEGTTEFLFPNLVYDGLVLINDAGNNRAYLMDKEAKNVFEWPLGGNNIGNDVFLLPDGRLLASLEADSPQITFGGKGGKIQFISPDGTVEWNFDYSTADYIAHHDVELLPNGNVITMVWERITAEDATQNGSVLGVDLFPEAIIEINPTTDEIVWEWHAWDHIIQDVDDTKDNFGVVSENPQLIDFNYVPEDNGDIMHANGIAYDPDNDLIYMSVNFFHEVWVIDHGTSTAEAASHTGGNLGKGGDLIYRFGNPTAYKNPEGKRRFYNNHFPNLLDKGPSGEQKLLIFVNKIEADMEQSVVYELQLPNPLTLQANTDNEPQVTWSFTDPDLFGARVSGAVELPNGNRMIAEADFGVWEVTDGGEVVWKFNGSGFFWRAYHYDKDAPEIKALGL
ncbi:aryl-sulfate sulfotransferase [Spongiimicrobium sp. 2-473A-2-J]|uniref:aryl-sulfate sulfotransferase n=1 Tax=Eudoraea algarum TaxID=3417568 RepID=UPI003D363E20